ncbi:N-6 DNA methylase, partial [Francisella tularensis]|uniref:N-6 DNA methylase n=1 Tax=Francisella tularensis TaxID=263 RepID=UPI002381CB58
KDLAKYYLPKTCADVIGIAFETFLGRTFLGELGQFFTPRKVVEFMVDVLDIKKNELICDPCAGSVGFLIRSFELVKDKIDEK